MSDKQPVRRCTWCGGPLPQPGIGRPRLFCGPSHRQRAYEARRQADAVGLDPDAVIVSREQVSNVQDRLWALRDALALAADACTGRPTVPELRGVIGQLHDAVGDLDQLWLAPRD